MLELKRWQLMYRDMPIAILEVYGSDQPWHLCNFLPFNKFEEHREFFTNFQTTYSSGSIKDFGKFFGALKTHEYTVQHENTKMVEFIILLESAGNKARLRSREVVNT